jgi:hypothetical protein
MDTLIRPDYLSVASETKLIRAAAPGMDSRRIPIWPASPTPTAFHSTSGEQGGWSSDSTVSANWNVANQKCYIAREATLLDQTGAIGWFQITFAELNLASLEVPELAPLEAVLVRPRLLAAST